jgi:hypothetical protein
MRTTLLTAAVLSSALWPARASELAIYPSFAEVREPVQVSGPRFDWTPPADLNQFLILGSLELRDPSVTSLSLLSAPLSVLTLFEGKIVRVWFHDEFVPATVIRAESFLFEIDGAFVQLPNAEVLYPSLDGLSYAPTFSWQRTGAAGTTQLRYATTAIAWENTRYTLNLPSETTGPTNTTSPTSTPSSLNAWIDISNASGVTYDAPRATLFAGDVLPQDGQYTYQQAQNRNAEPLGNVSQGRIDARPRIGSSGEIGGLQRYEYPRALRLNARSRLSLPFFRASPTVRRVLEYSNAFEPSANFRVGLQRTYRFKAGQSLPAGTVTVRENEQLVGQAEVPNTAKEGILKVSVGKDFDLKLNRSAQILERSDTIERARVVFTLKNTKARAVTVRLLETIDDAIRLEASGTGGGTGGGMGGFKRVPGAFVFETELEAGKTLNLTLLSTEIR